MRPHPLVTPLLVAVIAIAPGLRAQDTTHAKGKKAASDKKAAADKPAGKVSEFFKSETPFELTLTVNLKKLRGDRMDNGPWEPGTLSYGDSASKVTLPISLKTRGHSRLKICQLFPPVWIDLKGADKKKTVFEATKKFKLVSPCKTPSSYESYVIEEYNLYRLHLLMTPYAHLARLIHMTVVDSASKKVDFQRYAFAVEDPDEMSVRLGGKRFAVEGATAEDLNTHQLALVGILQYMIGNTDFSVYALHNEELVQLTSGIYPVNYDFDQSGVINTPYAIPDPKLGTKSVTERVYRGMCVSPDTVQKVLGELRDKRPAINALYSDDIGKLIPNNRARSAVKWFDDVYADLGDKRFVQNELIGKCRDIR